VPRGFNLVVLPVSKSWQEGEGLDLNGYKDLTKGNPGANWINASNTSSWGMVGGDYITSSLSIMGEQRFETGLEDLEVDVSELVEQWIAGTTPNYGVGIQLSKSFEAYWSGSAAPWNSGSVLSNTTGSKESYYTKRFFARGSQFFYKRPTIEARWDDARRDDRGEFYFSSSLAPGADNLNTIYLYNFIRGRLTNIPSIGTGLLRVSLYSGSTDNSNPSGSKLALYDGEINMTGGHVSTGIYSCSIGIESSSIATLYDVWHSGTVQFSTGSVTPLTFGARDTTKEPVYYINITNLANVYRSNETARMNLFVRHKNWNPTIYTKASEDIETTNIYSASYRIIRTLDNSEVVSYGTGSDFHTGLSYDVSGNYFDFDMKLLEPGYEYKFKFSFYDSRMNTWKEQRQEFRFRVEN
tara:strand:- start:13807 stop:15036 length:1230 start_codon:yes stop_codon:yes gene_type:complete